MTSGVPPEPAPEDPASGTALSATPGRSSWEAQVRDVRKRLLSEGITAGHDEGSISELVDRAADGYRHAPVQDFVGILVERAVREQLALHRLQPPARDP